MAIDQSNLILRILSLKRPCDNFLGEVNLKMKLSIILIFALLSIVSASQNIPPKSGDKKEHMIYRFLEEEEDKRTGPKNLRNLVRSHGVRNIEKYKDETDKIIVLHDVNNIE